jgi:hypothetical protein
MKKIVEARTKREHRNLGWFGFRFMALFGKGMPWIEWCLSTIHVLFLTFSYFLIIINIKTFLFFFFFFYITSKKNYYYSNRKIQYNTKLFHFSI